MSEVRTLVQRVMELAETQPDKKAVVFRKNGLTYRELADRARQTAARLGAMGIKSGDRVLFSAPSKPETFVLLLGVQYLGAAAVYIDKLSTPEHAFDIYDEVGAPLFLTDMKLKEPCPEQYRLYSVKELLSAESEELPVPEYREPDPEAVAEILFTSGTTGKPKGVMLSWRAVHQILTNTIRGIGIRPDDVTLMPLPLHHSLALRECRGVLWQGATLVLQNGFTFAKEVENNLDQHGCTGFVAVPVSMELLRGQMQEHFYEILGRFRYIEIGAGALTVEQRKRLSAHLPDTDLNNTWGSSETGGAVFTKVHEIVGSEKTVATIGRPLDTVEIRILDEENRPIASDAEHPGRLALRGRMTMSGYWNQPELTADALQDGWLVTNDLCYADENGYLYMLGRTDDIINIGGEKLSPLELENVASECPGLLECACIGVEDKEGSLGQIPVLFAAGDGTLTEEALRTYLSGRMERYKVPQKYVWLDKIPRNAMQKIDRKEIRRMWSEIG